MHRRIKQETLRNVLTSRAPKIPDLTYCAVVIQALLF